MCSYRNLERRFNFFYFLFLPLHLIQIEEGDLEEVVNEMETEPAEEQEETEEESTSGEFRSSKNKKK